MSQDEINAFEKAGTFTLTVEGQEAMIERADVEIISEDIPGWLVANEGRLTVALDITVTENLRKEGLARELVNRIQNLRKSSGYDITDKISVTVAFERWDGRGDQGLQFLYRKPGVGCISGNYGCDQRRDRDGFRRLQAFGPDRKSINIQ